MANDERVYQDYPGAAYILPADEEERRRLEIQHEIIKALFDGKLLPDEVTIAPGWRILDSGTGTGIWMIAIAKLCPPDVKFVGADISTRLFPASLPENFTLVQQSILTPPKDWSASFDLVHQRLLMAALRRSDWVTAIQNMYDVLKPGGYVVLSELNRSGDHGSGSATREMWDLFTEAYDKIGLFMDCGHQLPAILREAGFVDITEETQYTPYNAEMWLRNMMGFARAAKPKIAKLEGLKGVVNGEEDIERIITAAEQQYRETPGPTLPMARVTARKPL